MLTIILGIILAVIIFFTAFKIKDELMALPVCTALLIGIASIILGISYPISGYEKSEFVHETELVSLSNTVASEGGGLLYVSVDANNVYSYRYETESDVPEKEGKIYKIGTISEDSEVEVLEVETMDGSVPVIAEYVAKGKKSIWTFAAGATKTTYIFYVPEGSIAKNIALT